MEKYYKAEDVINILADLWWFEQEMEYPGTAEDIEEWRKVARKLYADLPTIEVEDDCISRAWVRENMLKYGFLAPDMTVTEFVSDAPNVVPKEKCDICCQYDAGYEDGKLDMLHMVDAVLKKRPVKEAE